MIIQRFGHAALLVEAAGARILVDPGTYSSDQAFAIPDLDAIVITHQHADHADSDRLPALLALSPRARVIAERQAIDVVAALGDGAAAFSPGMTVVVGRAVIRGVGGRHAVIHPDLPSVDNVGVTIAGPGEPTLFHPGDSYDAVPDGIDVLAIPVSAPWAKLSETVEFARRVMAATVFPIHDRALTEEGYPIYWRTIERLGGDARYVPLASSGRLDLG